MWLTKQRKVMIAGGLAALSVILALLARTVPCALAALAMLVSAVGDAILAGYPQCFADTENRLTRGGLVFWAAHALYIAALCVSSGSDIAALLPQAMLPFAVFLGLTVLHAVIFCRHADPPAPPAFRAAAFGYLLTVGIHAAAAIAVSAQTGGAYALNVMGTLLFYLSDAILLAGRFGGGRGKYTTALIWITYVPAQLCLMIGFFIAR